MRTPFIAVTAVSLIVALATPALADADETPSRARTEDALAQARRAFDGRGVPTGRELTPLLARVAAGRVTLHGAELSEAQALLARPTDGAADPSENGYSVAEAAPYCTANFCVHYVRTTVDAPDLTDSDGDGAPDVVETVGSEFEFTRSIENGASKLNWPLAPSDGSRGGDSRTDVYLADLGADKLYGYAAPEQRGSGERRPSYLVIDNDFAPSQYGGAAALDSRRPTIAHEYNHALQFGYTVLFDLWQGEASAVWAEEQVFPGSNDWNNYLSRWRSCTAQPGLAAPSGDEDGATCRLKIYGSATFEHFLTARYPSLNVVREAFDNLEPGIDFAPDGYSASLPQSTDFTKEFVAFAAASAEWKQSGFGLPDAGCSTFPDVDRAGTSLAPGATARTAMLDHTGYVLYDVSRDPYASNVRFDAAAPGGVDSAIALVGRASNGVTTAVARSANGGALNVTLPNPGQFDRITAVVANASIAVDPNNPYPANAEDWTWTQDGQSYGGIGISVDTPGDAGAVDTVTSASAAPCTKGVDDVPDSPGSLRPGPVTQPTGDTPATTPGAAPSSGPAPITGSPGASPTTVAPALSFKLAAAARQKRATVLTRGVSVLVTCNHRCAVSATLTLDRKMARSLKLSRTIGRASVGLSKAGKKAFRVKLSRKARAALRKRSRLKATLAIRTKAASGSAKTTNRTVTIVK